LFSSPASRAARPSGPRRSPRLRAAISGPAAALLALAGAAAGPVPAAPAPPVILAALARAAPAAPALASAVPASAGPARAKAIARSMLRRYGWSARQFRYLLWLWQRESGWRVRAYNRRSGATGIPQADPGRRMASAGRHWRTSARVQIIWGLRYIRRRYGSPRAAWAHEVRHGWY
jgi:hypothetical protein